MPKRQWNSFPYPDEDYHYDGDALAEHWERLHLGDKEPFPDAQWLGELCENDPAAHDSIPDFDGDFEALAGELQQAWRDYHRGEFQAARERGLGLGLPGYTVANKATLIYATHLEDDETRAQKLFDGAVQRGEEAIEAMPEHANAHYFHASALGRYSQSISIVEALARGLGGKIRDSLENTLELEPEHAEAHIALALYHAEIIDKVGGLMGGLTYGAKKDTSIEHFETALNITPEAPVAFLEYGRGLLLLYGSRKEEEAVRAFEDAAALEPVEAMERLDQDAALAELEE